ncbi:MAG: cytochrome c biogenesis CcdA family protein [Actinobacteria bacterium]|nr:cytochrome c biogenesis CcdA family protein [Actinomycetota bacterium]
MIEAPFALAFTAGLVATVNPCGFAMLPAYLSYFMGLTDDDADTSRRAALGRGLTIGAVVSGGFLLVFGVVGVLVTAGLRSIIDLIPWAAIVIGGAVAVLGIAMLAGYEPVVSLPKLARASEGRRYSAVFTFGVSYAVASLSCTLPIFLAVVAGAIPSTNLISGILLFVVYGIGMALVLMVVTLALSLGKRGLVQRLRRSARYVNRVSGAILLLAGAYIVWFWIANLSDPLAASGPITLVETWSSRVTELIGDRPLLWGGALGALAALALLYTLRGGRDSTQ